MPPILLFLGQALVLIALPFAIWTIPVIRRAMPLVVVQIVMGVALGPSLFGRLAPGTAALLLPAGSLASLSGLSSLAVLLFAFLTGLHLDLGEIVRQGRTFLAVGLASMLVPLLAGIGFAAWILGVMPGLPGPQASGATFAIGIGLCFGVTALPVLGAILRETGLIRTELGRTALGYAALNDVLLWVLTAALLATLGAPGEGISTFATLLVLSTAYFAVMVLVVKPVLARLFQQAAARSGGLHNAHMALAVAVLLASALATEALGLHYLIGAFAAGVVVPRSVAAWLTARLEVVTVVVLMPFFFIVTGLKVSFDPTSQPVLVFFLLSTVVAMAGKVLGTAVPARMAGRPWTEALRLGSLMQCKGLMEVIILTILRDAGVISDICFSALILVALVTTALTVPMATAGLSRGARFQPAAAPIPIQPTE